MTRPMRASLTAAFAVAAVLAALPARADHDDHDGWRRAPPPAPAFAPARYAPTPAPPALRATPPCRPAHWDGGSRLRALRDGYRALDVARDRFYAAWDGLPWTRLRFESWYAARRAALDARWARLGRSER